MMTEELAHSILRAVRDLEAHDIELLLRLSALLPSKNLQYEGNTLEIRPVRHPQGWAIATVRRDKVAYVHK